MNRILLLAMLCVASGSCVELKNICSEDSFEYKGVLVNAFHKVQWNLTFGSLNDYLINDTVKCDPAEFKNKTDVEEALRLKNDYNRKFTELYTDDLNGNTVQEIEEKWSKILYANGDLVLLGMEEWTGCIKSFKEKADSGLSVFNNLRILIQLNWAPSVEGANFEPKTGEAIKMQEKLIDKIKNSTEGQTFAFGQDTARNVYLLYEIHTPKEFKFLSRDSDRISPETKSMLKYEQFLPFNNQNHGNLDCVAAKELPRFFQKKGKF